MYIHNNIIVKPEIVLGHTHFRPSWLVEAMTRILKGDTEVDSSLWRSLVNEDAVRLDGAEIEILDPFYEILKAAHGAREYSMDTIYVHVDGGKIHIPDLDYSVVGAIDG